MRSAIKFGQVGVYSGSGGSAGNVSVSAAAEAAAAAVLAWVGSVTDAVSVTADTAGACCSGSKTLHEYRNTKYGIVICSRWVDDTGWMD